MTTDTVTAWASIGTLVVIGASAVAALIQLRHMRAGNQLEAFLALERDFRNPELQAALEYVQSKLPDRMEDPIYRAELARIGFVDVTAHPELLVCNWFNKIGTLVKHRLISAHTFMDLFARLIVHCWKCVAPAVAVMRRSRGDYQYHDFEYLAMQAESWLRNHPHGIFPAQGTRAPLVDRWLDADRGVIT